MKAITRLIGNMETKLTRERRKEPKTEESRLRQKWVATEYPTILRLLKQAKKEFENGN